MKQEIICGLPFYTTTHRMEEFMKIGELIENIILTKSRYGIEYPDDKYLNAACNILESLPRDMTIDEAISKLSNATKMRKDLKESYDKICYDLDQVSKELMKEPPQDRYYVLISVRTELEQEKQDIEKRLWDNL